MDITKTAFIDSKGYGKIYKKQMKDPTVPLVSKALLAYLSSYAGSGTSAYPKREKILRDMNMGKDTFAKYMGLLEKSGYISRKRIPVGITYNILTTIPDEDGTPIEIKSMGYGTVPKLVMLDQSLSAKAKGVYAYMCSYAGAGNSAYPFLGTILNDLNVCKSAYYGYYNELVSRGYISVIQNSENGRFQAATYKLNEMVYTDPGDCFAGYPEASPKEYPDYYPDNCEDFYAENESDEETDAISNVENPVGNSVENLDNTKAMAGNPIIGESVSYNFGQPYNNNNTIISTPLFNNKGVINNTRARDACEAAVENSIAMSRQEVRSWMNYPKLIADAKAWADTKEILGHFCTPADKEAYLRQCKVIANELARQLLMFFRRKSSVMIIEPHVYEFADLCQNLMSMTREELSNLCLETADKGDEVRCLSKYMAKVVQNRAVRGVEAK